MGKDFPHACGIDSESGSAKYNLQLIEKAMGELRQWGDEARDSVNWIVGHQRVVFAARHLSRFG
jgi:hypothetical protein